MANELVISGFNITYNKSGSKVTIPIAQLSVNVSGSIIGQGVVLATTSAGALSGLPSSPGYAFVKNLDATNFVQFGPDNTNWAGKLTASNPWALYPLNGTALYLKADTASCNVQYCIFSV